MSNRDHMRKAEPSRQDTTTARSFPTYSTHKLTTAAAAGLGDQQGLPGEVQRMMRTEPEDPRNRPLPHVITVDDVTRGLGLDSETEQRIQRLVTGSTASFTQKTQTQRIMHARQALVSALRLSMRFVSADHRDEIVRRAMAYWRRNTQTDYGKNPTIRFVKSEERKMVIPVVPLGDLSKGQALGGKYYRRVPTGNPERPWKYYYTREAYQEAHGPEAHHSGPETKEQRAAHKAVRARHKELKEDAESWVSMAIDSLWNADDHSGSEDKAGSRRWGEEKWNAEIWRKEVANKVERLAEKTANSMSEDSTTPDGRTLQGLRMTPEEKQIYKRFFIEAAWKYANKKAEKLEQKGRSGREVRKAMIDAAYRNLVHSNLVIPRGK